MGINQWVGASILLHKVILSIFQSLVYYWKKSQIFKKSRKLLISSLKSWFHRCCLFLSSLWCSAKSTSFLRGQGKGYGVQTIFETFKSRMYALSKKDFLFLPNRFGQFACINKLVMTVIMWFLGHAV